MQSPQIHQKNAVNSRFCFSLSRQMHQLHRGRWGIYQCSSIQFMIRRDLALLLTLLIVRTLVMLGAESNANGKKGKGRRSRLYSQRSPTAAQAQRKEATNQVMIGETDMSPELQSHAVRAALEALDVHEATDYKEVAFFIKKEFDKEYGTGWQCISGVSFGSYVTHASGSFIHFCFGRLAIMLFKAAC